MKTKYYLMVAAAGTLWGTTGFFVQGLYGFGFSPLQVASIRMNFATLILCTYVYFTNKTLFYIKMKDAKYFVGTGILGISFFNWCYFTAIQETSMAVAVTLLYTAPLFVAGISRFVFNERFTREKLIALIVSLLGVTLIIEYLPYGGERITLFGLLIGLGSGLGYGLYSIFGKLALNKYKPITITIYTFIFSSVAMLPVSGLWRSIDLFYDIGVWFNSIGLGLIATALAYVFYTNGLSGIESSKAAVVAVFEPVVAMLLGVVVFKESLTLWQTFGIALVLSSVLILQQGEERTEKENEDYIAPDEKAL